MPIKENKYTYKKRVQNKKKKQIVSENTELFHKWNWLM